MGMNGGNRPGNGKPPGTINKRTKAGRAFQAWLDQGKKAPMQFLLEVMDDPTHDWATRIDAAKAAAPYCHPKLAAHVVKTVDGTQSHEDWLRSVQGIDGPKLVDGPTEQPNNDLGAVQHDKAPIVIDYE